MEYFVGIDESHVCVVDAKGNVEREAKVLSEPEALRQLILDIGLPISHIGPEAGPMSVFRRRCLTPFRRPILTPAKGQNRP